MKPLVELKIIKKHLRLTRDDEDEYLSLLSRAAVRHFENWTGTNLVPTKEPKSARDDSVTINDEIRIGLLMLIAHWYENREAVGTNMSEAPLGTYSLWAPHRILTF